MAAQARKPTGHAEARQGRGVFANAISKMIGFPTASANVPVNVALSPQNGGEL